MATETGKSARSKPNARARSAALREQQRKKEKRQRMLVVGGIVVVVLAVVGVMIGIAVGGGSSKKNNAVVRTVANPTVVQQITTIPASIFSKGDASAAKTPSKISGDALTIGGKPGVLYIGAEYCPYCATERWPVVAALSRFGSFSNLGSTTSAAQDVYPSTPTFSFYKSSYTSQYLTFQAVETETNQVSGNGYSKLETPTAAQKALITKYNSQGSIPFIDFGNKFTIVGASYDPGVLQGKSMDEIAAGVIDPTSKIGKSVLGTANQITAAICETTGGKPGNVCDDPTIAKLRTALNAQK